MASGGQTSPMLRYKKALINYLFYTRTTSEIEEMEQGGIACYYTDISITEMIKVNKIHNMDVLTGLRMMPDESVNCCVTSPPYWNLRDYKVAGQIGLEKTPGEFIAKMVEVFQEVKRVLRKDGTCWVNMGDSYSTGGKGYGGKASVSKEGGNGGWHSAPKGFKHKDIMGMPWRLAFALQDDGWSQ